MISCTTLITHSEVARNQNRFSWNNTRMWFHTSVIVFSAVNVQQRCVQPRDGKYRSRDLCSIWSNPVTSKGRGGGHGRTRSELRWLMLIRELAGTTLVWAHFILWAWCCHRSAQNESQHRDSRYFAWLRKKKKSFTRKALSSFLSGSVSYTICHHRNCTSQEKTLDFI